MWSWGIGIILLVVGAIIAICGAATVGGIMVGIGVLILGVKIGSLF